MRANSSSSSCETCCPFSQWVGQALGHAERAYADALAEHRQLIDLLDALRAKAAAHGLADVADLKSSEQQARDVLARRPAPMTVARSLVAAYQSWLTQLLNQESA
jgi:glucuronate isomerase